MAQRPDAAVANAAMTERPDGPSNIRLLAPRARGVILAYVGSHKKPLLITLLAAAVFTSSIFPRLSKLDLASHLRGHALQDWISAVCLLFLLLVAAWRWVRLLAKRYWNTFILGVRSFLPLEYLFWFITFSSVLIFFFRAACAPGFSRYFLILATILVVAWLVALCSAATRQLVSALPAAGALLADDPIAKAAQDALGRQPFVDGFYNEIVNVQVPFSNSFVFGLYGEWGQGKTSVINMLIEKFDDASHQGASGFLIFKFDPWYLNDEKALLLSFYDGIERTIASQFVAADVKKSLRDYARIASPKVDAGIKFDFNFDPESLDDAKERVESYILNIGKKIVVIVDDIDRVPPSEILTVLKIVRLNGSFKNTIFVLCLDYEKTREKLDSATGGNGAAYLEKIIQKPVQLPRMEWAHVDRLLFLSDHPIPESSLSQLGATQGAGLRVSTWGIVDEVTADRIILRSGAPSQVVTMPVKIRRGAELLKGLALQVGESIFVEGTYQRNELEVDFNQVEVARYRLSWIDSLWFDLYRSGKVAYSEIEAFDTEIRQVYSTVIARLVRDLRNAKRFINSLYSSLPPVAGEVNLVDFILLEFLKVYAPSLYSDIFDNWWFYVQRRSEADDLTNPLSFRFLNRADEEAAERQNHILAVLEKSVAEPETKAAVREIIGKLFPNVFSPKEASGVQQARKNKKLYGTSFSKYFTLSTAAAELPDAYVQSVLEGIAGPAGDRWFLELRERGKLKDFLGKLNRVFLPQVEPEAAEALIEIIYKNAKQLARLSYYNSELDQAEFLLVDLVFECVEASRKTQVFEQALLRTPDLYFAVAMLQTATGKNASYEGVLRIGELRSKLVTRLSGYFVDGSRNIFAETRGPEEWQFIIHMWATEWETGHAQQVAVSSYVLSLLKNEPGRTAEFLRAYRQITRWGSSDWDFVRFAEVFPPSDLKPLVEEAQADASMTEEYRLMLNDFLNAAKGYTG